MTWGKVDDKLHSHPKPERAGLAAMGLWTLALSYCCDLLTDGVVSRERAARLAGGPSTAAKLAAALVAARLWHPADAPCDDEACTAHRQPDGTDGWRFHAWGSYQPTRASVDAERKRKQEAGRRGGISKAERVAAAKAPDVAPAVAGAVAPASPVPLVAALPPIPIPIPNPDPPKPPDGGLALSPVERKPAKRARAPKPDDEPHPPGHAEVVEAYFGAFEAARGSKPVFGGAEGTAVRRLLEAVGGDADRAITIVRSAYEPGRFGRDTATIRTIASDPSRFIGAPAGRPTTARFDPRQQPAPPGAEHWTPNPGETL